MSARVCPGDGKANNSGERIVIQPEDMAKAVELGIVPDEVVAAGKTFVTHDEMRLYSMREETNFMSVGMTAWRAIAFSLERDLVLPAWVKQYLAHVANGIEDWAALNEHPSALKEILDLGGKRRDDDNRIDPRWVYDWISQMKEQQSNLSIASLASEYLKAHPDLTQGTEAIRQKYYEGKKLAETGQDYKGRGRKSEMTFAPLVKDTEEPNIEF